MLKEVLKYLKEDEEIYQNENEFWDFTHSNKRIILYKLKEYYD